MRTLFTERAGLGLPVCGAPMAGLAGGRLAAAVADAGGMGMIGASFQGWDELEKEIDAAERAAGCPGKVGVGFLVFRLRVVEAELAAFHKALTRKPAAVWLSCDKEGVDGPGEWVAEVRKVAGPDVFILCQVNSVQDGMKACDAGADAIVAQGLEAGGHQGFAADPMTTFSLVPSLRVALEGRYRDGGHPTGQRPVLLAAGGIVDGFSFAGAMALGADGVAMGSRLYASKEAAGRAAAKERIVGSEATVRTRFWDVASVQSRWPQIYCARTLRNKLLDEEVDPKDESIRQRCVDAKAAGDYDSAPVYVSQAVDRIRDCDRSASDIVKEVAEAGWNLLCSFGSDFPEDSGRKRRRA